MKIDNIRESKKNFEKKKKLCMRRTVLKKIEKKNSAFLLSTRNQMLQKLAALSPARVYLVVS